jgi:hypothetical protein
MSFGIGWPWAGICNCRYLDSIKLYKSIRETTSNVNVKEALRKRLASLTYPFKLIYFFGAGATYKTFSFI